MVRADGFLLEQKMSRHLGTLTLDMLVNLTGFRRGLQQAEQQTRSSSQNINHQFRTTAQVSAELNNNIRTLQLSLAGLASYFSVQEVINYADSYVQLNNKLNLVVKSEKELRTALDDTFKIAQETASTWSSVNEIYTKFAQNQERLKLTQQEVADITKTVAKAVGMSGATATAADAALMQFGQALNTGILRGAELNSVMSQTPALAKAIAEGMGVTIGDLKKLGEQGKITTEVMISALQKVAPQIEKEYAKTATTISESFNRVNNEITKLIGETDKLFNISTHVVEGVTALSENLTSLAVVGGVVASVFAGRYATAMVSSTKATLQDLQTKILAHQQEQQMRLQEHSSRIKNLRIIALEEKIQLDLAIAKLRDAQMSQMSAVTTKAQQLAMQQLITAQIGYEIQLRKSTQATQLYNVAQTETIATTSALRMVSSSLLGVFGGAGGLAITLATLAGGYLLFKENTQKATIELDIQGKSVAQLVEEYKKLEEHQKRQLMRDLTEQIKKAREEHKLAVTDLGIYIDYLSEVGWVSSDTAKQVSQLAKDYRQGKIGLQEFGDKMNELTGIEEHHKQKLDEKIDRLTTAKRELKLKNDILNGYQNVTQQATDKNKTFNDTLKDTAERAKQAKSQLEALSEEGKKYLDSLTSAKKLGYIQTNMKYGWSFDKASFMFDAREKLGIPYHELLSPELKDRLEKDWQAQEQLKNMASGIKEKKSKENKSEILKSKTIDSVIASGEGDYRSYNRGRAGDSVRNPLGLDITKMTIGQIMQRQAMKGSQRLFAVGKYQVIPDTMKQAVQALNLDRNALFDEQMQERILTEFLLTAKKSRGAIEQYIKGQSNNVNTALHQLSLEFASIANPFTGKSSYDKDKAGNSASISVAKAKAGLEASRKLYAETLANTGNAQLAWKKAFSGYAEIDKNSDSYKALMEVSADQQKASDEQAKKEKELADEQRNLMFQYMPKAKQAWEEHLQNIEKIKKTFADNQARQDELIQKEQLHYQQTFADSRIQVELSYMNEIQKLSYEHQQRLQNIAETYQPTQYDNQEMINTLEELKNKYIEQETNNYNQQLQKLQNIEKMAELEYEKLQLDVKRYLLDEEQIITLEYEIKIKEVDLLDENEQFKQARKDILSHEANKRIQEVQNEKSIKENAERENTWSKYQERFGTAENPYLNDLKLLQDARQQMLITEQEYFKKLRELHFANYVNLGQAMTGSLMQMVDETSTAYSVLFALNKGFAVAQSLISIQQALAQAMANPYPMNLTAYATVLAHTASIVSTIQGTQLRGMAHNGMTNIPKEGTWLLDGGERVLNPKQNQDLTRYLQERSKREPQNNNAVSNNIKIVNSFDESMLVDAMNSRRGEQIILNVIKRNKSALGF